MKRNADTPPAESRKRGFGRELKIHENDSTKTGDGEEPEIDEHYVVPAVLTSAVRIEEERLHKISVVAEARRLRELSANPDNQMNHVFEESRYVRLMTLLNRTRWFSEFMAEKLTSADRVEPPRTQEDEAEPPQEDEVEPPQGDAVEPVQGDDSSSSDSDEDSEISAVTSKPSMLDFTQAVSSTSKTDCTEPQNDFILNAMGIKVSTRQPKLFEGGVMRDYQLDGLEWLKKLDANSMSGILGDEMGLGKTIQIIGAVCALIEAGLPGPFLIIAPLSTLPNWLNEFNHFAPKVPTIVYHGNTVQRSELRKESRIVHNVGEFTIRPVVITSFQVPLSDVQFFRMQKWRYMVVDEGHRIKNHNTLLAKELRLYDSVTRVILTGTPLQNSLCELWALLNFLMPEFFDDFQVFESWFDAIDLQQIEGQEKIFKLEADQHILAVMHSILVPFLLRRTKADVNLALPPKKEMLVFCPMSPLQLQLYAAVLDRTISNLNKQTEEVDLDAPRAKRACVMKQLAKKGGYTEYSTNNIDDSENVAKASNSNVVTLVDPEQPTYRLRINMTNPRVLLRHIVNHPYLVQMPIIPGTNNVRIDDDLIQKSGKILVLHAMLIKLKQQGHKVLIFSGSTMMLDLLADYCDLMAYSVCRLDGSCSLSERQEEIMRFNSDENVFAFLVSTRAGGLGINLTAADTVILYDSDWNPQADLQAQDRCHRIGQTRPVVVFRLITEGTIDEFVISRASAKRKLEKLILPEGAFKNQNTFGGRRDTSLSGMNLTLLKKLLNSKDYERQMKSNGYVFSELELEILLDRSDMGQSTSSQNPNTSTIDKESLLPVQTDGPDKAVASTSTYVSNEETVLDPSDMDHSTSSHNLTASTIKRGSLLPLASDRPDEVAASASIIPSKEETVLDKTEMDRSSSSHISTASTLKREILISLLLQSDSSETTENFDDLFESSDGGSQSMVENNSQSEYDVLGYSSDGETAGFKGFPDKYASETSASPKSKSEPPAGEYQSSVIVGNVPHNEVKVKIEAPEDYLPTNGCENNQVLDVDSMNNVEDEGSESMRFPHGCCVSDILNDDDGVACLRSSATFAEKYLALCGSSNTKTNSHGPEQLVVGQASATSNESSQEKQLVEEDSDPTLFGSCVSVESETLARAQLFPPIIADSPVSCCQSLDSIDKSGLFHSSEEATVSCKGSVSGMSSFVDDESEEYPTDSENNDFVGSGTFVGGSPQAREDPPDAVANIPVLPFVRVKTEPVAYDSDEEHTSR